MGGEKDGAMAPDEALGPRRQDRTGRAGRYTGQVARPLDPVERGDSRGEELSLGNLFDCRKKSNN